MDTSDPKNPLAALNILAGIVQRNPEVIREAMNAPMPRCTVQGQSIVSPLTDPINRNTAAYHQLRRVIGSNFAAGIQAAYERDLAEAQAHPVGMAWFRAQAEKESDALRATLAHGRVA